MFIATDNGKNSAINHVNKQSWLVGDVLHLHKKLDCMAYTESQSCAFSVLSHLSLMNIIPMHDAY